MLGRLYSNQDCSAARALEIVGERWSLLILRDAMFRGFTRYSDFERSLGIAPNILATRLEAFIQCGLMRLESSGVSKEQRNYVLTERGREFAPVIMALTAWGDKWVRPGPISFVDTDTGDEVELRVAKRIAKTPRAITHVGVKPR